MYESQTSVSSNSIQGLLRDFLSSHEGSNTELESINNHYLVKIAYPVDVLVQLLNLTAILPNQTCGLGPSKI